jgi:hypothetical protein
MLLFLKSKQERKIDILSLNISHIYNVLTSFNKVSKTPSIMFLEDYLFR